MRLTAAIKGWWPRTLLGVSLALICFACAPEPGSEPSPPTEESSSESEVAAVSPQELWWQSLESHCGQAFLGMLVSNDDADADLAGEVMTMHVRRCEDDRIEVPFHIGENRSRTWVFTRSERGIQLKHDHRHEDGSEDAVTMYGGHTAADGTATAQSFPVDDESIVLFKENGLDASVVNVWSVEVVPDERYSYILRRPGRHFQADFDLSQPVELPPAPWGHEETAETHSEP